MGLPIFRKYILHTQTFRIFARHTKPTDMVIFSETQNQKSPWPHDRARPTPLLWWQLIAIYTLLLLLLIVRSIHAGWIDPDTPSDAYEVTPGKIVPNLPPPKENGKSK